VIHFINGSCCCTAEAFSWGAGMGVWDFAPGIRVLFIVGGTIYILDRWGARWFYTYAQSDKLTVWLLTHSYDKKNGATRFSCIFYT
jgi:hypothetical protein